jgi:predicted RNase H-like HicB family nuclease
MTQTVHVRVRFEDQAFWATVDEYPGVFATGDTLEELRESLEEGIALILQGADGKAPQAQLSVLAASVETVASSELTLSF